MKDVKLASVSAVALASALAMTTDASAQTPTASSSFESKYTAAGNYMSGDFHNHTTCSDGATSVQTLTQKSLTYLDWFIQADHSGSGERDCRFDDFANAPNGPRKLWVETIGAAAIKGDPKASSTAMWRWQSLQEYQFPIHVQERIKANKPVVAGMEWTVPGHEHTSMSVITGQYGANPNAAALSQFEYCFAAPSNDTSQGGGQGWTCDISAENNTKLVNRFATDPGQGPANYNGTLSTRGINTADDGDHVKSTAAVHWMQQKYPGQSYAVPAHLERAGAFVPGQNRGFNVEHLRDWNNASGDVAFGFESQPGHQASDNRGEYSAGRSPNGSAGQYTYGGTGCYAAAESAKPGFDFNGQPLTAADFTATGRFPEIPDSANPAGVTLCQPGIRTMWDAMLSEGRKWWFFASSDWHSRGAFAPFDVASTNDFWPGEYQKTWTFVRKSNETNPNPAQDIVDGLRGGNSFVAMGDLIDQMQFRACVATSCATMGGTLNVRSGANVTVTISVRDPSGTNLSPYSFNNPALLQMGIRRPINQPEVAQVDLIQGDVGSKFDPIANFEQYRNPLAPATTRIAATWSQEGGSLRWTQNGDYKVMAFQLRGVTSNKYIRVRGSNLPAGTPNKRDASGNPLSDNIGSAKIACADAACPAHVNGKFEFDVEGWSDLSFFGNPIFINVQ